MKNVLRDSRGLTIAELMVAAMVAAVVVATILSAWVFAYRSWMKEDRRTRMRVGLLKATEMIKSDIQRSSATYISFYPDGADTYTAISLPVAVQDADGLYTLNAGGEIEWDQTVIYHVYDDGGNKTLRRTVFDPRDNALTASERYTQLENVATAGQGGDSTDMDFLEDLDNFGIQTLPYIIDFYTDSGTPVRSEKVTFGWVRMAQGDHTVRFEVVDKNDSSLGYGLGVDYLKIVPCGRPREVEVALGGGITTSGGPVTRVHDSVWSNNNYLEYGATVEGDYIEFTDFYDMWRESAFEGVSRDNTYSYDDDTDYYGDRIVLELPWDRTEGVELITWQAHAEAFDPVTAGSSGYVNPSDVNSRPGAGVTVRTIISSGNISEEGDYIRVKLKTYQGEELWAEPVYITRQDGGSAYDYDGCENQDPSGLTIPEYHRHQQLFFKDPYTGEITPHCWLLADSAESTEMWSEWTAFPLVKEVGGTPVNYLLSMCVPYKGKSGCKYWQGTATHTYSVEGLTSDELARAAGTPDWSAYSPSALDYIFAVEKIDAAYSTGTVESSICDAGRTSPPYSRIRWAEDSPTGTEIILKARSSNDEYLSDASDWDAITGWTTNPKSLGTEDLARNTYVQFLATLTSEPFWEAPGQTLSYANYVSQQRTGNVWDFPENGGVPLTTAAYSTWVDDVELKWNGNDQICVISGVIARKNNYGQAKVSVDGEDLIRVLEVDISASMDVQDQAITEESTIEVEPRNTGK
jgi:hypothetical protein